MLCIELVDICRETDGWCGGETNEDEEDVKPGDSTGTILC